MASTLSNCRTTDARSCTRSSIYLAAALYFDSSASSVKVRNLSSTGALVEGMVVPSVGSSVRLVRHRLTVDALVVWSTDGRCGLRFSDSVDVQQWRAVPHNSEQQRVDEIVRLVKAGTVPLPVPPLCNLDQSADESDPGGDFAGDLRRALDLLENLGGVLACDSKLVSKHGKTLQNLDIAMQVITAVAAAIENQGNSETDASKLLGLRRSAIQGLDQQRS
jgi:hypothetical protein